MEILIETVQGKVPVTVLELHGELDGSNFEKVIAQAKTCFESGNRDFLIDMSDLTFMSSSGLVALHSIALISRFEKPDDLESGWSVFHSLDQDNDTGFQEHVKLLNPQPRIIQTLNKTGMNRFFEVFTDRQAAIASF